MKEDKRENVKALGNLTPIDQLMMLMSFSKIVHFFASESEIKMFPKTSKLISQ